MTPVRRDAWLLVVALAGTFIIIRSMMWFTPDQDLFVAGYNIPHLFTGLLILTIAGIPLLLLGRAAPYRDVLLLATGVGLSLALDEWVYLIVTDGSNAAYLTPVSFWGGVIVIGLSCALTLAVAYLRD